jgi:malonyl-CoA/methylmalonyl-CoA synthetase
MILYTSGTTNKPKGVLTTHANIEAQIESLVEAWKWKASDRIPLFLPLHHIHGIINVICCAMWSGALVEPFARFDINAITNRVRQDAYTVFMAVPTIYVKLIQMLESTEKDRRDPIIAGFKNMRLMVSGSAALPATVHDTWFNLTGQKLLERYGMTEIGMALSNPYDGERRPGSVGKPLPGVNIRLKSDSGKSIEVENEPGEIQISGPGVFKEYWNRPQITSESFDEEIWFRTGDMAVIEHGYYRIMGRLSTDIIKSGGYKLSALEIESTLLQHPNISECAVVGIQDDTWGEAVAVAVILREGTTLQLEEFREWCRARLSVYKIPKHLVTVATLPKNAMGKVVKKEVSSLFK